MRFYPIIKFLTFQPTPSARRVTQCQFLRYLVYLIFQPTPSARRVTNKSFTQICEITISTHTLRKEGDNTCLRLQVDI